MGLLDSLKKRFAKQIPIAVSGPVAPAPEPEEIRVPEVTATDLMAELRNGGALLVLVCREDSSSRTHYEYFGRAQRPVESQRALTDRT